MKISEFIGGFITGISILFITLGMVFLDKLQDSTITNSNLYFELLIPYISAVVAGLGLGFGLKSDEGGLGYSFSLDMGEQLPILVGALALAGVFGLTFVFFISQSPINGLILEIIASLLVTFGLIIVIVSWDTYRY